MTRFEGKSLGSGGFPPKLPVKSGFTSKFSQAKLEKNSFSDLSAVVSAVVEVGLLLKQHVLKPCPKTTILDI